LWTPDRLTAADASNEKQAVIERAGDSREREAGLTRNRQTGYQCPALLATLTALPSAARRSTGAPAQKRFK